MKTSNSKTSRSVHEEAAETRCECGQLIAKVRGNGLELKCKRCKRIVHISFNAIEGWTPLPSQA
jgi:phage FluMu protein Com